MKTVNDDDPGTVARKHLLTAHLDSHVDRIESHQITLRPRQKSGIHVHPGGVVGCIVQGDIMFAIGQEEPTGLRAGDVFYEPPGVAIAHFDNASDTAVAIFVAFYPMRGDQPLIVSMER